MTAPRRAEALGGFTELRHILIPFWALGVVALALAAYANFGGTTMIEEHAWALPALLAFGGFASGHALASAQEMLRDRSLERTPEATLHPGQFAFVLFGLFLLAALASVLLIIALFALLRLSQELGSLNAWVRTPLSWIGSLFLGACILWVVLLPFHALYKWFGARQHVQQMRDKALFALADQRKTT